MIHNPYASIWEGDENERFARPHVNDDHAGGASPPLQWDEALKHPLVRAANGLSEVPWHEYIDKLDKFHWLQRLRDEKVEVLAVEGDVSTVFSSVTNDDLVHDVHCIASIFPDSVHKEVESMYEEFLHGRERASYIWPHRSDSTKFIQVTIHGAVRFFDAEGAIIALQVGTTTDVSDAVEKHSNFVRELCNRERDAMDHRFGNRLRLLSLELQNQAPYDVLLQHFEQFRHEISIRRNHLADLPSLVPVYVDEWMKAEFIGIDLVFTYHDGIANNVPVFFETIEVSEKLHPIVLQVMILQDLASNASKHSTGTVYVHVYRKGLQFFNDCHQHTPTDTSDRQRKRIGLSALLSATRELKISLTMGLRDNGTFSTTLGMRITPTQPTQSADVPAPFQNERDRGGEMASSHDTPRDYTWMLVDDDALICKLFTRIMANTFDVSPVVLQRPGEVTSFLPRVCDALENLDGTKGLIILIDENLIELDTQYHRHPVTGTVLRDRFFAVPHFARSVAAQRTFLVSASASHVDDDRINIQLGKGQSVKHEIDIIMRAIAASRRDVSQKPVPPP